MLQVPMDSQEIVITAALAPQQEADTAASATVIDAERIDRLGEPLVPALLRLAPSTSVAASGPAGSLTEVRIRGAENNHTLLFVDGIRVNDPASGNQPRYELLNADIASRIEVVRGPQSALWGSEAIGGVVAVNGAGHEVPGYSVSGEAGSLGFRRASASGALVSGTVDAAAAIGWQRATGIDAFDGNGDRDGYRTLSGRLRGTWKAAPGIELGLSALALSGRSEFDGFSPLTFLRADTLDSSRNRLNAGRVWSRFGNARDSWSGELSASLLRSSNRNYLADDPLNRTNGGRWTITGQARHRFTTGAIAHTFIAAAEHEQEDFRARDVAFGGQSNQDRSRAHQALTAEWRSEAGPLVGDVALRHDRFSRFADVTSLRASLLADIGHGFALSGSYGEGIGQPTFFDLYGFFPNDFKGNPSLEPESSRGVEASIRYRKRSFEASASWFRQRLSNEIVDVFDPVTFVASTANRDDRSRRSGVELEVGWQFGDALRLTGHYAFLDATEPGGVANVAVREVRRPKHSGGIALDGQRSRFTYGASLTFTGRRTDTNFDLFPPQTVQLGSYWLGGARVAYAVRQDVELFVRASNLLDQRYEDVFANRTEGRGVYAGIRLTGGR